MLNPQAAALDPNFSDPQVYGPQPPAPRPSVLDMLRSRMAREMEGEDLRRIGEFGAGMLASGSPNFFTMLGAGARAAREGDVSRMERLRQLADAERQDAAQRAEEQRRQEELRLRREEMEMNAPFREAQTAQARALAEYYRQGGRGAGGGAGVAGQVTPALRLRAEQQAATEARREFPDPVPGMPATEARLAEIRNARQQYIARRLPEILEGLRNPSQAPAPDVTAAPPAPAAVLDLSKNPGGNPPR